MDQIKYQFGDIETAAADIRATAGSMNALLDDLKQQLRPMVSTWEGDSASAYQTAQAKWDSAAAELNTILETIASTKRLWFHTATLLPVGFHPTRQACCRT